MYTKEKLEKLSTSELNNLKVKLKNEVAKANIMQLGIKVTLNSAYGMIGNQYSRYYDVDIAEGITVSGQLSIRWIERKLDEYLNKLCKTEGLSFAVAGDTDSIYLSFEPLVNKFFKGKDKEFIVNALDKICEEKIQPYINSSYEELADYMNAYEQKMVMAREVIADRGLWRAKKNYALNVWDSEGVRYSEPKVKILGIECVKSSTPKICRDAITNTIKLIMNEDEKSVQDFIKKFKTDFYNSSVFDISKNSGVSDLTKWHTENDGFIKGTPYHVKGSMVYNRLIEKYDITNKYNKIQNGMKVKLVYLKKENPTHNNLIAFPDELPPEFGLDKYIDKKVQYEKCYLKPSLSLLNIIGWQHEKKRALW